MHATKTVVERTTAAGIETTGPAARQRLQALDAFRGLAIAAMILVNNPGSWKQVYAPLQHSNWNGCTPADLIFPFFLFIVGVAISLSFARRGGSRGRLVISMVRRTLLLFALGMLLNGFPFFDWETMRLPGILQRVALCYGAAALITMALAARGRVIVLIALLSGYWLLMKLVPVPGVGAGGLAPGDNLAAYIDSLLMSGHLLHRHWDPEGLLTTLPAIATTLCGVLAGDWLRAPRRPLERVTGLFVAGNTATVAGLIADAWFPINKSLWSPAYVLFTAGVALNALAMCYWLIDVRGYQRWAKPFVILGMNAIVAYLLSSLLAKAMLLWRLPVGDGTKMHIKALVFDRLFASWAAPITASLCYAITYTLLWLAVAALLYRRQIFIKI